MSRPLKVVSGLNSEFFGGKCHGLHPALSGLKLADLFREFTSTWLFAVFSGIFAMVESSLSRQLYSWKVAKPRDINTIFLAKKT